MRISLQQPQLLRSLQAVERAVNDRSALPILANILLETKEQELILTATDLDVGVQYRLPLLNAVEPGAVTLPARRLSTIVRELPEELVMLEAKKNHTTTLSCGTSQFRIPGLPPEDFPIFPPIDQPTTTTQLPQALLKELVAHTAFAMSMEETQFVLNGTLLKTEPQLLTLVATDGRRLAVATTPATHTGEALRVVLPAKTIRELGRLLEAGDDGAVAIAPLKDNQLLFRFGDVTIITRLIEGQFPAYESVIPALSPTVIHCRRQPLLNAVRRANLMTTATSQAVVFELASNRLTVSKESTELGSAREELEVEYDGGPMTIAFNPEFWLDGLKALAADEVAIEVTSPEKPAVVRLPQWTYIVLPMKLA